MGFHAFENTYDWGRVAPYRETARQADGGIIDLSVGSPVDPTPLAVRQVLSTAADAPDAHGYPRTEGSAELRDAISAWFRDVRRVDVERIGADFVPTVGSKEAVALMASLLHLGPGDVVVQPEISYPTYEIGTQLAGAEVRKVADVADVDSWRTIPGVKAIWVNSPSNPTGEVLSSAQLGSIVKAARAIGAVVLSDECYALLTWSVDDPVYRQIGGGFQNVDGHASCVVDGPKRPASMGNQGETDALRTVSSTAAADRDAAGNPPATCMLDSGVCEGSANGILVLYSLSKQSNMAGYRTALVAGDPDLIGEMKVYRKQIGQIIPGPVQAAMAVALRDIGSVEAQRSIYERRFRTLVAGLRAAGYDAHVPQGALYVWVRAKSGDCWQDMSALARVGIVPSPGEFYGTPDHLRFSVTATDDAITEAARRLAA